MSKGPRVDETRRWLRYAGEDLTAAEAMIGRPNFVPRQVCWLAQQSGEKTIKSALVFLQIAFPRSHDLDGLRNLLPDDWQLKANHPDLAGLSEWAVESRYPGNWPDADENDARGAVEQARALWKSACADFSARGINVERSA